MKNFLRFLLYPFFTLISQLEDSLTQARGLLNHTTGPYDSGMFYMSLSITMSLDSHTGRALRNVSCQICRQAFR